MQILGQSGGWSNTNPQRGAYRRGGISPVFADAPDEDSHPACMARHVPPEPTHQHSHAGRTTKETNERMINQYGREPLAEVCQANCEPCSCERLGSKRSTIHPRNKFKNSPDNAAGNSIETSMGHWFGMTPTVRPRRTPILILAKTP